MDWKAFWNESGQLRDRDCCRQVGRTFKGVAYSDSEVACTVERLLELLDPVPDGTLLDLGRGNGLVTSRLARHFRTVTGLDFSQPLIDTAKSRFAGNNVEYVLGDAIALDAVEGPFDRVLMSAALQFVSRRQAARMFRRLDQVVAKGGRIVLADVADRDRIWNFYRGLRGKLRFVGEIVTRTPTIGYWWGPSALCRVANTTGWIASTHYQPATLPNYYFRYDAVLERSPTLALPGPGDTVRRSRLPGPPQ